VNPLKCVALAVVAVLAVGCGSTAVSAGSKLSARTSTGSKQSARTSEARTLAHTSSAGKPLTTTSRSRARVCSTSAAQGSCGPYNYYRLIKGITSSTYIGNNVWNPIPGWSQTLHATNPGSWYVMAKMPRGNTAVVSYPSVGANYGEITGKPTPLSHFESIYSSFSEKMHATRGTSAWAAYDIWLGQGSGSNSTNEVMIQHDFANNGPCQAVAHATFGGSGGVKVRRWNLCQFGTELVWKLTGRDEPTGSVDILAMLKWLVVHRYLPRDAGLFSIGYGWEICSTGGVRERFQVNKFSITPIAVRRR
jgi:hypothetical protein